jgi:tetratricopeptide (TPR) repeat protein
MHRLIYFIILLLGCVLTPWSAGQEHDHGAITGQLGTVSFPTSCTPAVQKQFERAVAMLHSFWYEESEKNFAEVAVADPSCAIAYWGVAMSLYHPLWYPPDAASLKKGSDALAKAKAIGAKTARERDFIAALDKFYSDSDKLDHKTRAAAYKGAMEQVAARYPEDREATIFYALALLGSASPTDKTYSHQRKAGAMLEKIFAEQPNHPGVAHYIIHSYDYPPLVEKALPAARAYAKIAPSAPHALHMPSHIFTRVGLWQESIQSNVASERAAKDYGERTHMKGAWGQQLHAMDYLEYAYLQTGQDAEAKGVLDERRAMQVLDLGNDLTAGYSAAAIPARYTLELRRWSEAAALDPASAPSPVSKAIIYHAKATGAARSGDVAAAKQSIASLEELHDSLTKAKEDYWAGQVEIQRREAAAWMLHAQEKQDEAVAMMRSAADMEDATEKHPVTPGAVVPAHEALGDLLLELKRPADALPQFEQSLQAAPNRFNGLYGAAKAAELSGDAKKAGLYYSSLIKISAEDSQRPQLAEARSYLKALAAK